MKSNDDTESYIPDVIEVRKEWEHNPFKVKNFFGSSSFM